MEPQYQKTKSNSKTLWIVLGSCVGLAFLCTCGFIALFFAGSLSFMNSFDKSIRESIKNENLNSTSPTPILDDDFFNSLNETPTPTR